MRGIILLPMVLVFGWKTTHAQEINQTITDPKSGKEILIDKVSREAFETPVFGDYYLQDYEIYQPDAATIEKLKPLVDDITITVVLASWCGDSREQLPRFLKVIDQLGFDQSKLSMYAVDSYKTGRKNDVSHYQIEKVPTFIFYKGNVELGRIIETPLESLEIDMYNILNAAR